VTRSDRMSKHAVAHAVLARLLTHAMVRDGFSICTRETHGSVGSVGSKQKPAVEAVTEAARAAADARADDDAAARGDGDQNGDVAAKAAGAEKAAPQGGSRPSTRRPSPAAPKSPVWALARPPPPAAIPPRPPPPPPQQQLPSLTVARIRVTIRAGTATGSERGGGDAMVLRRAVPPLPPPAVPGWRVAAAPRSLPCGSGGGFARDRGCRGGGCCVPSLSEEEDPGDAARVAAAAGGAPWPGSRGGAGAWVGMRFFFLPPVRTPRVPCGPMRARLQAEILPLVGL